MRLGLSQMITRFPVKCETCEHHYTLRISIGSGKTQEHSFACVDCHQKISLYFEKNYNDASFLNHKFENCEPTPEQGGDIINLHPDFAIPPSEVSNPVYFASLEAIQNLQNAGALNDMLSTDSVAFSESMKSEKSIFDYADLSDLGQRVWGLLLESKDEIAEKFVSANAVKFGLSNSVAPLDLITAYCESAGRAHGSVVAEALENGIHAAEKVSKAEADKAFTYLQNEHFPEVLENGRSVLGEYAAVFRSFSPLLIYLDKGIQIPESAHLSTFDFDVTKKVYGNAFEALTSSFIFPALLNNVIAGRSYDTFERLSLSEYLKIDKSGKHNCFQNNPTFAPLIVGLDNQLRNASHHERMSIHPRTGVITYRPSRDGRRKSISYTDYSIKTLQVLQTFSGVLKKVWQRKF